MTKGEYTDLWKFWYLNKNCPYLGHVAKFVREGLTQSSTCQTCLVPHCDSGETVSIMGVDLNVLICPECKQTHDLTDYDVRAEFWWDRDLTYKHKVSK